MECARVTLVCPCGNSCMGNSQCVKASLSDLFVYTPQAVNDEDYNKTVRCMCGVEVWCGGVVWRCGVEV